MSAPIESASASTRPQRLFTFRSGGWVVLLMLITCATLIAWAMWGVIGQYERPPGDGKTIESYGFDLSTCLVDRSLITPGLQHRDFLHALSDPPVIAGREIDAYNKEIRGKYLVGGERVIGVSIQGEHRAYPIQIMNVHEVVNDTLGGVPIAVTYNMLCDSVVVVDRRPIVDGERASSPVEFGVSGLVMESNLLLYDRVAAPDAVRAASQGGGLESLWSQLQARAITGPAAASHASLQILPASLTRWSDWLALHPDTTVIKRDERLVKRYKISYERYFETEHLQKPVKNLPPPPAVPAPPPERLPLKARIIAIEDGKAWRVVPHAWLARLADDFALDIGGTRVVLRYHRPEPGAAETVDVTLVPENLSDAGEEPAIVHALWFAWYAAHPDSTIIPDAAAAMRTP
jgi:hypothetical protein